MPKTENADALKSHPNLALSNRISPYISYYSRGSILPVSRLHTLHTTAHSYNYSYSDSDSSCIDMASIFGKKNRTSASSSTHSQSSPGLVASVPYSQLASGPPPVAGPSTSGSGPGPGSGNRGSDVAASRLVSAPSTNPTLTDDGTPVRVSVSATPTKGEGSRRSNASFATTTTMDTGMGTGTGTTGRSSSHEYQEMLRRATLDTNHQQTPIYETMASSKTPAFSPYSSSPHPVRTPATPGTPGTPSQEFGMRPYPYVAGSGSAYGYGKSPETSSIRSMSSVNSTYDPNNPMSDTGRYPKFETQSIPGLANGSGSGYKSTSTPTTQSTTSLPLPSPLPNRNGEYARPPDQEIEFWYQQILQKTDLDPSRSSYMMSSPNPSLSRSSVVTSSSLNANANANASSAARSAANLPMDSKWTIVQQYWKSREQQQHQQHQHQHHKHHETTPKALGRKMATTATAKSGKGSVEYFLSHALSRTLTPAILFSLEISLRTETLE